MSIFEICSERGKGEKAYDLLGGESSELSVQQSTIRGLKEVCELFGVWCFLGDKNSQLRFIRIDDSVCDCNSSFFSQSFVLSRSHSRIWKKQSL